MKKFRLIANILSFTLISYIIIFTPLAGGKYQQTKPQVKAAYISKPILPISKGLTPPDLTATGIYMIDFSANAVLFQKNPHFRLRPASLTKIMTSLVSLDYYSPDTIIKVKNGQNSVGNTAKLVRGDQLTVSDTLYALLVPSGNDAALTLAENYPGGYGAFLEKMNQKVSNLGLSNTHFSNVSGIETPDHYTTAFDILIIAKNALRRPSFSAIVSTQKVTIKSLKGIEYSLLSTNQLLGHPGILGVKTGWTPEAGECLIIFAEKDGNRVLLSLLNSKDRFGEAEKLVNWAFENYY